MTVNSRGQVLVQEDVGSNAHIGKIWLYDQSSDSLTEARQSLLLRVRSLLRPRAPARH